MPGGESCGVFYTGVEKAVGEHTEAVHNRKDCLFMKVLRSVRDILAALVILYTSEILGMMGGVTGTPAFKEHRGRDDSISSVQHRCLSYSHICFDGDIYETGPEYDQKGMDAWMQRGYLGNLGSDDDMSSGSDSAADGSIISRKLETASAE